MDKRNKEFERYKKNPIVLFEGKDGKRLGSMEELEPMGYFCKPLISSVLKDGPNMTRIFGAYGVFQFVERGKHWEISSFNEYLDWGLIGEFDKCPQVDRYEDLLYLRAVKLKEQWEIKEQ